MTEGSFPSAAMRRAFSMLAFCAAMAVAAMFPDAQGVGISPLQIPPDLVDTGDLAYDPTDFRFQTPQLCENLGGELRDAPDGKQVCVGVDRAGSFCIVGSGVAFPCRGLYKHVIECNAKHNRPAHDMFLCASRCDDENQKARGAKCERIFSPSQAVSSPLSTVFAVFEYSGAAGELPVSDGHTLTFPPTGVDGFELRDLPPNDFAYYLTAPLTVDLDVSLTATVACDECYPDSLTPVTVGALFSPVVAPQQDVLLADEGAEGELILRPPSRFAENATLRIARVSPQTGAFVLNGATLSRPANAPAVGTYAIVVEMTHPEFLGVLTLPVTAEITVETAGTPCDPARETVRGGNCGQIILPAFVAPSRNFTIFAAAGHSGPAGELLVNTGRTLAFPPAGIDGFELRDIPPNDFAYHLTAPLGATLEVALTATILCDGCYPDPLTVSAVFSPVFAPRQGTLRAPEDAEGELTLRPPSDFAENADLRIVGVSPPSSDFILNNTVLSRPADAPATGNYAIFVEMTHDEFHGALTLRAEAEIGPRAAPPPPPTSSPTRFTAVAAAGHSGAVGALMVNDGNTLTFPQTRFDGFALTPLPPNDFAYELTAPLSAHIAATLTASVECDLCRPDESLTVSVTISPVFAPRQGTLRAPENAEGELTLRPPSDFAENATLRIARVSPPTEGFVLNGATLSRPANAPPAGTYEVFAGMTHPGFIGVLTLRAVAELIAECDRTQDTRRGGNCGRIVPPSNAVSSPVSTVSVAAGHSGAAGGLMVNLGHTLTFPPMEIVGFELTPSPPNNFAYRLTAPLDAPLEVTLTATILCDGCYPDPLTASVRFSPVFAPAQGVLRAHEEAEGKVTLRPPSGFAENAVFQLAGVSPQTDGFVLNGAALSRPAGALPDPGTYTISVGMTHSGFIGVLTLLVTAELTTDCDETKARERGGNCGRIVPPSDVVSSPLSTVSVAAGHSGPAGGLTVNAGHTLTFPPPNIAGFGLTPSSLDENDFIYHLTVPLDAPLEVTLTATILCDGCYPDPVTVGALFSPVVAPAQDVLRAHEEAEGKVTLRPPSGFAENAVFQLAGVSPQTDGFVLNGAVLSRPAGAALLPGSYTISAGMTHPGFVGVLTLLVTAEITTDCDEREPRVRGGNCGRIVPPSDVVLSPVSTVSVAAGYFGLAGGLTVESGYALFLPPMEIPGFVARPRPPNDFVYQLRAPLNAPLEVVLTATILCDGCHPDPLTASVLFAPVFAPQQETFRSPEDRPAEAVLRLPSGFAENAALRIVEVSPPTAPADAFTVSGATLSRPANAPAVGAYDIFMEMTHPGFIGVLPLRIAANIAPTLPESFGVDRAERARTRTVARSYVGPVAAFSAGFAGVTLRTPAEVPAGFHFPAGADFAAPAAFTVSLSHPLEAGTSTVAAFTVTALADGYWPADIPIALTVRALQLPPLPSTELQSAPFSGEVFDFKSANFAGGDYKNAVFRKAENTSEELSEELSISADGIVSATVETAGLYGLVAVATAENDFAGTVSLALLLTVGWRFEYGIAAGSGPGILAARDAGRRLVRTDSIVAAGAALTLFARPAPGYYVSEWGGDCQSAGQVGDDDDLGELVECALTADKNLSARALFSAPGARNRVFYGISAPDLPRGAAVPSLPTLRASLDGVGEIGDGGIAAEGAMAVFRADVPAGYFIQSWIGADQCAAGQNETRGPTVYACPPATVTEDLAVTAVYAALPFAFARIDAATLSAHCENADGRRATVFYAPPNLPQTEVGLACIFDREPDRGCFAPSRAEYNPHVHSGGYFTDDAATGVTNWGERMCDDIPKHAECAPDENISHDHDGNPLTPCVGPLRRVHFSAVDGRVTVRAGAEMTVLQSGGEVYDGTMLHFAAAPSVGFYLSEWRSDSRLFSHCPAGTAQTAESECETRATGGDIGVTVVFLQPGLFTFAGDAFNNAGQRAAVRSDRAGEVTMTYHGERRGLRLMRSAQTLQAGDAEQICQSGGADDISGRAWRLPSLPEALGALNDAEGEMTLGEVTAGAEVDGAAAGMRIPLRTAQNGDADNADDPAGFFADLYGRRDGAYHLSQAAVYDAPGGGPAARINPGGEARVLCVLEAADDYGLPDRLARVVLNAAGQPEAVNRPADALTITMRLTRRERTTEAPAVSESLFSELSADPRLILRAEQIPHPVSGESGPGRLRAVLRLNAPPQSAEALAATIAAWPAFGLTVRMTTTVRLSPGPHRAEFQRDYENGELRAFADGGEIASGYRLPNGARATFIADPADGYYVAGWDGACADADAEADIGHRENDGGEKSCELQLRRDIQVTVRFDREMRRLNFADSLGGALSAADENGQALQNDALLAPGATVTFTAAPAEGFYVSEWRGCDDGQTGSQTDAAPKTCAAVATVNLNVAAVFSAPPVQDPTAALIVAATMTPTNVERIRHLISLGANPGHLVDGRALLLHAAEARLPESVSVLIANGAPPGVGNPAVHFRQVPHIMARHIRNVSPGVQELAVVRAFAAALAESGFSYNWNTIADPNVGGPLDFLPGFHRNRLPHSQLLGQLFPMAHLFYEQGSRCNANNANNANPLIRAVCALPVETMQLEFPNESGPVLTVVARDLGRAIFNLSSPSNIRELEENGWSVRHLTSERPAKLILERRPNANFNPAVFTVNAVRTPGDQVSREYRISVRAAFLDKALENAARLDPPDLAEMRRLTMLGANPNAPVDGQYPLIRAAEDGLATAVSALIVVGGSYPAYRSVRLNRRIPHLMARTPVGAGYVETLKSFIVALDEINFDFNWNIEGDAGRPLDFLANPSSGWFGNSTDPRAFEMAELIYERGGRCSRHSTMHCRIPVENMTVALRSLDQEDALLTIVARDLGSARFTPQHPGPDDTSALFQSGWRLTDEVGEGPRKMFLRRIIANDPSPVVFTITVRDARNEAVREHRISVAVPLNKMLEDEARSDSPDLDDMRRLIALGADPDARIDGEHLLIRAADGGLASAVSALIVVGANPDARRVAPGFNRGVPHLMARSPLSAAGDGYLETMKSFIAALQVRGAAYDWNLAGDSGTPLDYIANSNWFGNSTDPRALEMAALIYERGGRCNSYRSRARCQAPVEHLGDELGDLTRRGDVLTIVARDFAGAQFSLTIVNRAVVEPALVESGWPIRDLLLPRPHRIILQRGANQRTMPFALTVRAVAHTVDAEDNPIEVVVREYRISDGAGLNRQLEEEARRENPDIDYMRLLTLAGANPNAHVNGLPPLIRAALDRLPGAVSALIVVGAHPETRQPGLFRRVPHLLALAPTLAASAETMKGFIAALDETAFSFNWNLNAEHGRPLDHLVAAGFGHSTDPQALEIAALLYERGGRCARHNAPRCHVPVENLSAELTDTGRVGDIFTIVARDFAGDEFNLTFSAALADELERNGWTLRAESSARPRAITLARVDADIFAPAIFTVTAAHAESGGVARIYPVSANADLDRLLYGAATLQNPDFQNMRRLIGLGANPDGVLAGRPMLINAAFGGLSGAVSALIAVGANHLAADPGTSRQIPHLAARNPVGVGYVEMLTSFIVAVHDAGFEYKWNSAADAGTPLNVLAHPGWFGNSTHPRALAVAGLIYERGGRCSGRNTIHCQIPTETISVAFADENFAGDLLTIAARDLGGAEFNMNLPASVVLADLRRDGWTLRVETDRPQRIILNRFDIDKFSRAVFSVTAAALDGDPVRIYEISATPPTDRLFAAAVLRQPTDIQLLRELLDAGANPNAVLDDERPLLIAAAEAGLPPAVSVLLVGGANHLARHPVNNRQVPHIAARNADDPARMNVLRNYIVAAAERELDYDWNTLGGSGGPAPLDFVARNFAATDNPTARETAALIHERGGRCQPANAAAAPVLCAVPVEKRSAEAFGFADDILTIVARDLGGAEFNLNLPAPAVLADLQQDGWTLRLQSDRPQKIILNRAPAVDAAEKTFTVTAFAADSGQAARIYAVSVTAHEIHRLITEALRPSVNVTLLQALISMGADPDIVHPNGIPLLITVAEAGKAESVSVLIAEGANHEVRHPTDRRQVPHIAADNAGDLAKLNVLRNYIVAVGGRDLDYDWMTLANGDAPLDFVAADFPDLGDDPAAEVAALIYERGGRCASTGGAPAACGVPAESVVAQAVGVDFEGDALTIAARDLGGAEFDFAFPDDAAVAALTLGGWTLRVETDERPHQVVASRFAPGTPATAAFTITANSADGEPVRTYAVLASTDANIEFAAEIRAIPLNVARAKTLIAFGADPNRPLPNGTPLLIAVGITNQPAISLLIAEGADPEVPQSASQPRQIPHFAMRHIGDNPRHLNGLRGFIEGVETRGYPYDWNTAKEFGRPLDWIITTQSHRLNMPALWEGVALVYERGGRCSPNLANRAAYPAVCGVPEEAVDADVDADFTGDALTITARIFATLRFSLALPADNVLSTLGQNGWTLRAETESHPHKVILSRGDAGDLVGAGFAVTAFAHNGPDGQAQAVRRYDVLADSAENIELVNLALSASPDLDRMRALITLGANPDAVARDGSPLLIAAAEAGRAEAVSVLVVEGANHAARHPANNRQVPHIAAAGADDAAQVNVLRHYIAALNEEGIEYDWSVLANDDSPLDFVAIGSPDADNASAAEVAALLYERGGRCESNSAGPAACGVPIESIGIQTSLEFSGDIATVAARDFGGAEFDLILPSQAEVDALALDGWTLRAETASRPHTVVVSRIPGGVLLPAVFTIDARPVSGAEAVRRHAISLGVDLSQAELNRALALEVTPMGDVGRVRALLDLGASPDAVDADGVHVLIRAAEYTLPEVVSVLVTANAILTVRHPNNRDVPLLMARNAHKSGQLSVVQHFAAAISHANRTFKWNTSGDIGTPLGYINWNYPKAELSPRENLVAREMAAVMYDFGARCGAGVDTGICNGVAPRTASAEPGLTGDVYTIVADDLGRTQLNLSPPSGADITRIAANGWSARVVTDSRPHTIVVSRSSEEIFPPVSFTVTATRDDTGVEARKYAISTDLGFNAMLVAELESAPPDLELVRTLLAHPRRADPDAKDDEGVPVLIRAAERVFPEVVSVLITANADPAARHTRIAGGRDVPLLMARNAHLPGQLSVVRYFAAALSQANKTYNWNTPGDIGTPLDHINREYPNDPNALEMAAVMYDYGARCGADTLVCNGILPRVAEADPGFVGDVLTIVADDLGRTQFNLPLSSDAAVSRLSQGGWALRAETDSRPHKVVLSRVSEALSPLVLFTITARFADGDAVARKYAVSACHFGDLRSQSPGSDCVFDSLLWRGALEFPESALRATITAAAGYAGDLRTVAVGTAGDLVPVLTAAPQGLFAVTDDGRLSATPENMGDSQGALATVRITHPGAAGVYFETETRITWVSAPSYQTLEHPAGGLLDGYVLSLRATPSGHPGELEGGTYSLTRVLDGSGDEVADPGDYYNVMADGRVLTPLSGGLPTAGSYTMEITFTHDDMKGGLILEIPLEVRAE